MHQCHFVKRKAVVIVVVVVITNFINIIVTTVIEVATVIDEARWVGRYI